MENRKKKRTSKNEIYFKNRIVCCAIALLSIAVFLSGCGSKDDMETEEHETTKMYKELERYKETKEYL